MDKTAAAIRQPTASRSACPRIFLFIVEVGTADILCLMDRGLLDRIHQDDLD